ncbi:hypothetical protein HK098_005687, partial [Nowakowskiella sp. JEL0407]
PADSNPVPIAKAQDLLYFPGYVATYAGRNMIVEEYGQFSNCNGMPARKSTTPELIYRIR